MAFGEIAKQLAQHALADQIAPTPSVTAQSDSAGAIMLGQIQAMQKACTSGLLHSETKAGTGLSYRRARR